MFNGLTSKIKKTGNRCLPDTNSLLRITLALASITVTFTLCVSQATAADSQPDNLIQLRKIYLSVHAFPWINVTPDDPRRQTWGQFWPGRWEAVRPLDFEARLRVYQIIRNAQPDEGLMIVPTPGAATDELIAYAQQYFGDRSVVTEVGLIDLGPEFDVEIFQDRILARAARAEGISDWRFQHEFNAWVLAKTWATDLRNKLNANGYTFDPATVEFVAWGCSWAGCAGTYPIQIARAFNLTRPIKRRWDLIVRDTGPIDVINTRLVVQLVPLPNHPTIHLYIYKNDAGRYCAELWETIRGPMDPVHNITLNFPPNTVRRIDHNGNSLDGKTLWGTFTMPVPAGGHTASPRRAILEATAEITLDDFYTALMAGTITEMPLADNVPDGRVPEVDLSPERRFNFNVADGKIPESVNHTSYRKGELVIVEGDNGKALHLDHSAKGRHPIISLLDHRAFTRGEAEGLIIDWKMKYLSSAGEGSFQVVVKPRNAKKQTLLGNIVIFADKARAPWGDMEFPTCIKNRWVTFRLVLDANKGSALLLMNGKELGHGSFRIRGGIEPGIWFGDGSGAIAGKVDLEYLKIRIAALSQ